MNRHYDYKELDNITEKITDLYNGSFTHIRNTIGFLHEPTMFKHNPNIHSFVQIADYYNLRFNNMDPVGMAQIFTELFDISLFEYACEHNYQNIVDILLQYEEYAATAKSIQLASANGYMEIVQTLLLWNIEHRIVHNNNFALELASTNGHIDTVEVLLFWGNTDPLTNASAPLRFASENGHLKIVELLLSASGWCDPQANNSAALRLASKNGHTEVVRVLLQDKRADPRAKNTECLRFADTNGHIETVLLLLQDPRVRCPINYVMKTGSPFSFY